MRRLPRSVNVCRTDGPPVVYVVLDHTACAVPETYQSMGPQPVLYGGCQAMTTLSGFVTTAAITVNVVAGGVVQVDAYDLGNVSLSSPGASLCSAVSPVSARVARD